MADQDTYKAAHDRVINEIERDSDRATAVLLAAEVDARLELLLERFFLPPRTGDRLKMYREIGTHCCKLLINRSRKGYPTELFTCPYR